MPRSRFTDYLQDHYFWAFDASSSGGIPIFNPLFGFSRISAPEIGIEIESFKDGTFLYNRGVVKGGRVSPILFERAASMFDADFYSWIMFTLHGDKKFESGDIGKVANFLQGGARSQSPRRSLLIVHFSSMNIGNIEPSNDPKMAAAVAGIATAAGIAASLGGLGASASSVGIAGAGVALGIGPFTNAKRIPARAWLLHDCLPVRYRSGNDFDAASGQVSLMELEVQPEMIEEFSLGAKP